MYWKIPKLWGECWIIGGGPSIKEQFGIPDSVTDPTEQAKYIEPILGDKNVIGCNAAIMLGEEIVDLWYCGDSLFINLYIDVINQFNGLKVIDIPSQSLGSINPSDHDIKTVQRISADGVSSDPNILHWQGNTGLTAINLAILLGARRIFLLGFDMGVNNKVQSHWHPGLPMYEGVTDHINFVKSMRQIPEIVKHIHLKFPEVEILNVSPKSEITQWKKVSLNDVL